MEKFLPLILVLTLASCSNQERRGLTENQRNYSATEMEDFRKEFLQPSDAIYIFKNNIQYALTRELTSFCDSIFGEGFVNQDFTEEITSKFGETLNKYAQPNREIQIDSENIEQKLTINENGYSSLKFSTDDLTSSSPLTITASNLLTQDCLTPEFDFDINGYEITFIIDATIKEVKRDGIYTVSNRSKTTSSPYHKYKGDCIIGITIQAINQYGKTEYYCRELIKKCDQYTQMQYTNSEVTYL